MEKRNILLHNNIWGVKMKGIPKTEKMWVYRTTQDGMVYYITSKENDRSFYFLYEVQNGTAKKIGKAKTPIEFEKYIHK